MSVESRVLVTGANGFVGRALVRFLDGQRNLVVTAASRRPSSFPPSVRSCRIGDITPETDWRDALDGCNLVVHLAGRVHVMHDKSKDPLSDYRRINVMGTIGLARQAAAAGVKRFLFVSSVKVHGEQTQRGEPFTETNVLAPEDPYSVSKAEAEAGLLSLASTASMEAVVVRPPMVYGVGARANFERMARWLVRGKPLPLGAIRFNRRSLIALDNLVDFILSCLRHPKAANEAFLISDGEDLSTTDLLHRTAAALGVRPRLFGVPAQLLVVGAAMVARGDVVRRLCSSLQVDASKARRVLGWRPPISVDEGLRRAVVDVRRPPKGEG